MFYLFDFFSAYFSEEMERFSFFFLVWAVFAQNKLMNECGDDG